MIDQVIRIGTRNSELALYQANLVADLLSTQNIQSQIVEITSLGDQNLAQPIYTLGTSGVFTKSLDIALLNDQIDIAVHSLKDVPTDLPEGIVNSAVLERSYSSDIIKLNQPLDAEKPQVIATGSIRRKAQWLAKYPNHTVVSLRGNVNTRLKKLADNKWTGAIFAKAGLDRINLLGENYDDLDWMIPAPAQGAIVVATRKQDQLTTEIRNILNHKPTEITTTVEREFMNAVEAGCSFPLGVIATINGDNLNLKAVLSAIDGSEEIKFNESVKLSAIENFGKKSGELFAQKHNAFIEKIKDGILK